VKLFLCGLALVVAAAGAGPHGVGIAQNGGRTSALGGAIAAHSAMSRPLGGFPQGGVSHTLRTPARRYPYSYPYSYPYAYSWYVPSYSAWGDNSYSSDAGYSAPAQAAPAESQQQPVIINQYFSDRNPVPEQVADDRPQAPGDPIGTPATYYLIAYKNHNVYSALAYWVEDTTLHYVTMQNSHNQASLELIDLDLTKSLNQKNDVPFSIPGR
jgi:hypothetical protein